MIIAVPKRGISLYNELVGSGTNPQFAVSFVEKYGPKPLDPTVTRENDNELITINLEEPIKKIVEGSITTNSLLILVVLTGIVILGIVALRSK